MHPAIVDRATWQMAQGIAAGHGTSRDGEEMNTHPATIRFYPYRGRVRCRDCQRRMAGNTYGKPTSLSSYYRCPHNWANPKRAADHPDHPPLGAGPRNPAGPDRPRILRHPGLRPERAALLAD